MIEPTVVDLRVQMVLGRLGTEEPAFSAFSQGALQEFRERLIKADMDRRLLERTVELAKSTKAFDHRKLPKTLRVAIDSSPLEAAAPEPARAGRTVFRDALGSGAMFRRGRPPHAVTVPASSVVIQMSTRGS